MFLFTLCILKLIFIVTVNGYLKLDLMAKNHALDLSLYEDVLDPEECAKQLNYILNENTTLLMQFLDAGIRTPRGIIKGNFRDMGSYIECLDINEAVEDMSIEGKYCVVKVPLSQDDFELPSLPTIPEIPWPNITLPTPRYVSQRINEKKLRDLNTFHGVRSKLKIFLGESSDKTLARVADDSPLAGMQFELAVCIPKVCSVTTGLESLTQNSTGNLKVDEAFCRLPNDKPWVAADTVAVVIFSLIGLITIVSTTYDLRHSVFLKRDPKKAITLYTTFSVFTNSRKFFTFNPNPNAVNCLDGIRSVAMVWVIVGHTFFTQMSYVPANPLDMLNFITASTSLWITSATITVDTFFMISGLLLVYTTASKLSRMSLIKNLHFFYLNRLLRMFPVLATAILLQVSIQNRVTDGPYWNVVARNTNTCRQFWWTTLLYVQNLANPNDMCLGHSWYLAIDMQLYIISPIILYFVLGGNKRSAWSALAGSFILVITGSTIYNFLMEFQGAPVSLSGTPEDSARYLSKYYVHPLPRATPSLVGMIFGYALHLCKGKKIRIPKPLVAFVWILAFATTTVIFISTYYTIQPDWDNQTVNNLLNSFMRPAWAACIAWLTFACTTGYGGPINWFLSLHIFKILGRLSYAMYILHFPLIYVINATTLAPIYFSVEFSLQRFLIDFAVAVFAAFLVSVIIDLPCSRLIGMALGGQKDRKKTDIKKNDELRSNDDITSQMAEPTKTKIIGNEALTRI